jgi:hypothetical protein
MKFLFSLFSALLLLNAQNVMSQSFEFLPNDTITKDSTLPQYSSVLEVYGHVKNTSGNTLTLKWKRVTNSGTQSITQSFCDNSNCYSNNFISGIKTMDPIAAGDSGIMRLDLEAKCKTVTARVQILVWVDGDSANTAKTMTYISSVDATADCLTATAIAETEFTSSLRAYPNPATNQIAVKFESGDDIVASIIDINGRVVKEATIRSNDNIDIANLHTGIYLIRLTADGVLKGSIRFSKQ